MEATDFNLREPDHVIVWLDENMCVPNNNESSKAVLDTNANLNTLRRSASTERINHLIQCIDPEMNTNTTQRLIRSPLQLFIHEDECLEYINGCLNAGKQPFLIASGRKGKLIVPQVYEQLSNYIYIFCGQRDAHEQWTHYYEQHINIYDDDEGVFGKVLSDIAIHYLKKGQNEACGQSDAVQYLHWSLRLFRSASRIDRISRDAYIQIVNEELTNRNAS